MINPCLACSSLIFVVNLILAINLINNVLQFTSPIVHIAIKYLVPLLLLLLLLGIRLKVHIIGVGARGWENSCEVMSFRFLINNTTS